MLLAETAHGRDVYLFRIITQKITREESYNCTKFKTLYYNLDPEGSIFTWIPLETRR